MIKATVTLRAVDNRVLYEALSPELKLEFTRTNVALRKLEDGLAFRFEAEDVSSLRASMNSYLRWLKVVFDINEALKNIEPTKEYEERDD